MWVLFAGTVVGVAAAQWPRVTAALASVIVVGLGLASWRRGAAGTSTARMRVAVVALESLVLVRIVDSVDLLPTAVTSLTDDVLALVLILSGASLLSTRSLGFRVGAAALLSWPILAGYSAVGGSVPVESVLAGTWLSFKPVGVLISLACLPWDRAIYGRLRRVLLGLAVVLAVVGLVEFARPDAVRSVTGMRSNDFRAGLPVVRSLLPGPVHLAFLMVVSLAMVLLDTGGRRGRQLRWPVASLIALVGLMTLRVKALAGLAIVAAFAAVEFRRRAVAVLLGVAAIVVTLLVPEVTRSETPLHRMLGEQANIYSANETPREALYRTSWEIAQDSFPLGSGAGTFGSAPSVQRYSPLYFEYGLAGRFGFEPDNPQFALDTSWPVVLAEGGVMAVLLVASGLLLIVGPLIRRRDSRARLAKVMLTIVLVDSMASARLLDPFAAGIVGASIGYALTRPRVPRSPSVDG